MGMVTGFVEAAEIFQAVPGCPLATSDPRPSLSACATCSYNIVNPRRAVVGCSLRTSPETFDEAIARLGERDQTLQRALTNLLQGRSRFGPEEPAALEELQKLAERWLSLGSRDEASTQEILIGQALARFAAAARRLQQAILVMD